MAKRNISCFLVVLVSLLAVALAEATTEPPAVYIFGDSTLDVGTNNYIPECLAKADFYFNGIDFPYSEPTGRFSNGLNTADEIVRLLGLRRSPPPFLQLVNDPSTFRKNILKGANFASGGSGILNSTGQYQYTLYELGARKLGILTVPPIGCTPFARARANGNCSEPARRFAQAFYTEAVALLEKLSSQVPDLRYSLANTYLMTTGMMENMFAFGYKPKLFVIQFHPTQRVSELAALTLFGGSESFVAPMNFSQLLGVNI
ncbi:hypothetical protein GOBAR_AA16031 [Gossypium barbadense]|uniref:GDSL esterase/lipase n=1 Tax=Gossypium barbadense TaxID=3634 RepID=A0A2P5XMX3_GOSBA|nr:hypothetical protein GOBAR_AA16031 [Gossypium barbadense]